MLSRDGRGLSDMDMDRRGGSNGSSGTRGMFLTLIFESKEGCGLCEGVPNAPDFLRAAAMSASVTCESMLPALLLLSPASSLLSLNESAAFAIRVPIHVSSLAGRLGPPPWELGAAATNAALPLRRLRRL